VEAESIILSAALGRMLHQLSVYLPRFPN